MPVYPEAPRKEASSFSLDDISMLLDQMSDKEKGYSLRARSSMVMANGKQETVYLLFLRNGSESVFERLDNWWNAKAQRELARQLICTALAERSVPAVPGRMAMRTLVHERTLSRVRKMDKMAPEEIRTIFSECIAAQQKIQVFENKLLSISSEDRQKFQEFQKSNRDLDGDPEREKIIPALSLLITENSASKNPISEILAEAESHYVHAMLRAFMQFTKAIAENRPLSEIDLALVLAFLDKRKTGRHGDSQADTAKPGFPASERTAACWKAIDGLLDICGKLRCAPLPVAQAPSVGDRTALVPAQVRPPAGSSFPQARPTSLPALQASLFRSLWACGAGRSAGAVYAASKILAPAAKKMVGHAAPAATGMELVRRSALAPKPIRPARSPQDIVCDCQGELDLADIDREAVILVAHEGGLFSKSPACQRWLAELWRGQRAEEAHFVRVQYQGQTVLLARAQRAPMHGRLDGAAIRKLGGIYEAAVATAVGQHRPVCLTDVFDHDPHTADQCVEAMLAPIRRCYQQGLQPAIHIRVSSPLLRERIVAALKVLLATAPLAERAAVEVIPCLTEADRQQPGLIMVSSDSADPLTKDLARRHAQRARSARAGAAASARVSPRKSLGSNTKTHLYFFAEPCPLKNGLPDGARIAAEYAALFQAARQHHCKLVTLEILSETPGHEGSLIAALSAAIMAARAVTPDLKVRIVTRNKQIGDGMRACF